MVVIFLYLAPSCPEYVFTLKTTTCHRVMSEDGHVNQTNLLLFAMSHTKLSKSTEGSESELAL